MYDEQNINSFINFSGCRLNLLYVVILSQLLNENPGWLLLASVHHGHGVAHVRATPNIEAAHYPDDRFFRF